MDSPAPKQPTERIFLYGPSGSGKTTIGRILAESLNLPFTDLDEVIEEEAGRLIPEIFQMDGEDGFRSQETEVLSTVIMSGDGVIALGGGTLISPGNRDLSSKNGVVVVLNASVESLASRLDHDDLIRPLLEGDLIERLQDYLEGRGDHYGSFPIIVDTTGKTPDEVSWEIQVMLGMYHLRGMSNRKVPGYDLRILSGCLDALGEMLVQRGLGGPVVVVTDANVGEYYLTRVLESLSRSGFGTGKIAISPGEDSKTMVTVSRFWEAFLSIGIERGSTIVALGGGVVGDLAGFAAATYLRGVSWVSVPTSLLAMVDAGIGGKTGVDLPEGKNLVGAFHPPRLVLVDPEVLATLPGAEFANGMAEVVKHCVIHDPGLLTQCHKAYSQYKPKQIYDLLSRAIAVKVRIIEEDPYEKDIRAALNYGHTVGHGVELASNYELRHGEAVAIGMVVEARMAESIGLAEEGLVDRITRKLESLGLPVLIPDGMDRDFVAQAMRHDKKAAVRRVRFALPVQLGEVRVGVEVERWERYLDD